MYRLGKLPEGQLLAVLQWLKGRRQNGQPAQRGRAESPAVKPLAMESAEPPSANSR